MFELNAENNWNLIKHLIEKKIHRDSYYVDEERKVFIFPEDTYEELENFIETLCDIADYKE